MSGVVLVKQPGKKGFVRLRAGERVPVGSTLDTTAGVVSLTAALNAKGKTTTGRFYAGQFRLTQKRARTTELTVLTLNGPKPSSCTAGGASAARKHPRSARKRSLWGSASGGFSTVGGDASATELGTKWLTQDTCAGTLIKVTQGAVRVDDFPHHRTFVLKAPHSFLVRPRHRAASPPAMTTRPKDPAGAPCEHPRTHPTHPNRPAPPWPARSRRRLLAAPLAAVLAALWLAMGVSSASAAAVVKTIPVGHRPRGGVVGWHPRLGREHGFPGGNTVSEIDASTGTVVQNDLGRQRPRRGCRRMAPTSGSRTTAAVRSVRSMRRPARSSTRSRSAAAPRGCRRMAPTSGSRTTRRRYGQ